MEIAITIIFLILLVAMIIGFSIVLSKAKQEYKKDAYRLLSEPNANPKEIKISIKSLNRYVGLLSKDEEAVQLIKRLMDKFGQQS